VHFCEVWLTGLKNERMTCVLEVKREKRSRKIRKDLIGLHHSLVYSLSLLTFCHLQDILALWTR
jgi:hypothetical protein